MRVKIQFIWACFVFTLCHSLIWSSVKLVLSVMNLSSPELSLSLQAGLLALFLNLPILVVYLCTWCDPKRGKKWKQGVRREADSCDTSHEKQSATVLLVKEVAGKMIQKWAKIKKKKIMHTSTLILLYGLCYIENTIQMIASDSFMISSNLI